MRQLQLCLLFCAFLLPLGLFSQARVLKEADQFFNDKHYKEAYSLYQQVNDKKKDKAVVLKMADCNYFIENYRVAQGFYSDYFNDTLYHAVPQYTYYANALRLDGRLAQASKIYNAILQNGGDASARSFLETSKFYLDSAGKVRVYDVDSVYTCVDLDATESVDPYAAPMTYVWDFKDGTISEGIKVTHCFKKAGENKITLSIRDKATGYLKVNDTALTVFIDAPPVKFTCPKRARQFFYTTFDASALAINNYDILEYIWELGDGETALGKKIQHKYDKLEYYTVKLTVVAKDKTSGAKKLFAGSRTIEVVDNYSDHSQTFKDSLKGTEK